MEWYHSQAGKLFLIKMTLQSQPIYVVFVFQMPSSLAKKLDQICNQFLWLRAKETRKMTLVAWDRDCNTKANGGLGLQKMKSLNKVPIGKL